MAAETTVAAEPKAGHASGAAAVAVLLAAAWGLAIWSLPRIDPQGLDDIGLAAIMPVAAWVAYVLLALGFWLSLRPALVRGPLPLACLMSLVLLLHGIPAIAYGTLRYSWAWKHIGIVDFILRHGRLDPGAEFLSAYHNWPGFFVLNALALRALDQGIDFLIEAARFASVVQNLCFVILVLPIYRSFTADRRMMWTAAWIFVTGNWIGQDYFSPQGMVFVLYLAAIALAVGPLARQRHAWTAWPWAGRLTAWLTAGLPQPQRPAGPLARGLAAVAILVLILAITASHQLTPIILGFALAALALIGRLSLGYVLFAVTAEVLWAGYMAAPYMTEHLPGFLAQLGNLFDALFARLIDNTVVSSGQAFVSKAGRAFTGAIAVAAAAGGLRRLAHGHRDGPAAILALAPLPILAITSYGGEAAFRVYFFALPFLAFFAAALFFPTPQRGTSIPGRVAALLFCLLAIPGFIVANNGKDRQYWFAPDEVAAATWLSRQAPPGTLLVEGGRNYPSQFLNYENFTYVSITEEPAEERQRILVDPADVLAGWVDDRRFAAAFIIITRSQKAFETDLGLAPHGLLARTERSLRASPLFVVVWQSPNASIFAPNPALLDNLGATRP